MIVAMKRAVSAVARANVRVALALAALALVFFSAVILNYLPT